MGYFKRGFAVLMAGISAIGCIAPAFASSIWDESYTHNTQEGSNSNVDVNVLVQNRTVPVIFSAYVPATVKIAVSRDKQIITPENLRIINGVDTLPIGVWDVKTKPVNNWTILDWDTNFKDKQMTDQKKFAMTMNGNDLSVPVSKLPWEIQPAGELSLTLDAKIPYQSAAKDMEEIMTVSFTMDWMDRVDPPDGRPHANGTAMSKQLFWDHAKDHTGMLHFAKVMTNDPRAVDISEAQDGSVKLLAEGQNVTVYGNGGVKAPKDCRGLLNNRHGSSVGEGYHVPHNMIFTEVNFEGLDTSSTELFRWFLMDTTIKKVDVSTFDTSNATDFAAMFHNGAISEIKGLEKFNTSKGTDFAVMFDRCHVPSLDLSSFDLSNGTDFTWMFNCSSVGTVYCRTQDDLNKMKSSPLCPSSIHFVVGKPN